MKNRLITLYTKYLSGECIKDEFLEMRDLTSKIADEEFAVIAQNVWDENPTFPAMPEKTKLRVKSNLDFYIESTTNKKNQIRKWRLIAAAITLFIIAGSTLYYITNTSAQSEKYFVVSIDRGQKATIKLPDNSDVRLNAETELKYDINDTKNRRVYLKGEAFFEVAKDEKHPFIVDMGELQVEVLGTSFNVQTYTNDDYIQAALIEGSIKLTGKRFSGNYYLKPMEQLIYSKKDASLRIVPLNKDLELGWMSDRLVFDSEPLYTIIHRIERWYGVTIDLQCTDIKDDRMSGAFYKEDLKDVLEAIRIQYKVKYSVKENHVIIHK